mmetsp:Transcript_888/g.2785  ORF Transcript_888/g.2785 Transcript_888/m.2785 type:complete len:299 (+) Transcript_888:131-1027(+)
MPRASTSVAISTRVTPLRNSCMTRSRSSGSICSLPSLTVPQMSETVCPASCMPCARPKAVFRWFTKMTLCPTFMAPYRLLSFRNLSSSLSHCTYICATLDTVRSVLRTLMLKALGTIFSANSRTVSGYVALKKSTCRSAGSHFRTCVTCGPIMLSWSSITSASSSTKTLIAETSRMYFFTRSVNFPGVPTSTWHFGFFGTLSGPGQTRQVCTWRNFPSWEITTSFCLASSLVGQITMACGCSSDMSRALSRASEKVAVLPEPFCACPIMFSPSPRSGRQAMRGRAAVWIFEGLTKPMS